MFVPPTVTVHGKGFYAGGQPIVLQGFNANGFQNTTGNTQDIWRAIGGNFVRIRLRWSDLEPAADQYNQVELQTVQTEIQNYAAMGVQVLLDMHFLNDDGDVPAWVAPSADWFTDPNTVAEYTPVVQMLVNTFDSDPNVMGYEIWNEPQSGNSTAAETQAMIEWQAQISKVIRAIDPARAIVVMLHGGWDYGLQNADLSLFGPAKHLVLDFHDEFCGCVPPVGKVQQTGYTADGEAPIEDSQKMVNSTIEPYIGTLADQRAHLRYALRWRQVLHRPIIIGEWEVQATDTAGTVYQAQMLQLFDQYGLSWARWQGPGGTSGPGKWQLEDSYNGPLNAEGEQLEQYFHP